MHELGIADSIVKTVLKEMEQRKLKHLQAVGVRVGVLTDVVPEALEFSFQAITNGTPLSSARLKIEQVPLRAKCRACGKEAEIEQFLFVCPHCENRDLEIIQGDELHIDYIETSDPEVGHG
ncbi:MAG: hydrogenase maturation nickel metallochaperone HypA [candidate division Zixibacteria bacterium]|nr:hydrogenase maturation nickel metallochaperone HypA [candidate division Zixibacteria bacterium]